MLGSESRPGRIRRSPVRLLTLGIAAVTLAAAGLITSLTTGGTRPDTATAGSTATSTTVVHRPSSIGVPGGPVLFIGASYTAALGASDRNHGYAAVAAHLLGRRFTIAAVPGTGFVCPGPHHEGTFARRVAELPVGSDYPLIVVQGGRNDAGFAPALVQRAAGDTLAAIRTRFPDARVVVVGPILGVTPGGPKVSKVRDAQRAAAHAAGAGFVDPLGENWITGKNIVGFTGRVPQHPNDAGYAYIGRRLVADLPAAIKASATPHGRAPGTTQKWPEPATPATPPVAVEPDSPSNPSAPSTPAATAAVAIAGGGPQ